MRAATLHLVLALGMAPLAGCLSGGLLDEPLDPSGAGLLALEAVEASAIVAFENDHDHSDLALHAVAANMEQVAFDPLDAAGTRVIGEIDVVGSLLVVAEVDPAPGFFTVDVSDPAAPRVLGRFATGEPGYGADVKLSPDGTRAFLVTQPDALAQLPSGVPAAGTATTLPAPAGVYTVDVTDAGNPAFVAFTEIEPRGVHMAYAKEVGGKLLLFTVHNSVGMSIYEVKASGGLSLVSRYGIPLNEEAAKLADPATATTGPRFRSPHDVTVQEDPATGKLLALVPFGYDGFHLVDVSDPTRPTLLSRWVPEGSDAYYLHTAQMAFLGDDRVIVVVPEVFAEGQAALTSKVWVLDANDLTSLKTLGSWENPAGAGSERLRFSTHNFQIANGRVYLANYHGGVAVIDIATPEARADPATLGVFVPHEKGFTPYLERFKEIGYKIDQGPAVWDVVLVDGYVYASDSMSGLYALRYLEDEVGPGAARSIG